MCNEYLPLLSAHIDGMNSEIEERRLQQHLRSCAHCRERLRELEDADAALRDTKAEPPADLTERIMAQVRSEPRKKAPHRRKFLSIGAAGLAAAAMLALVLYGNSKLPGLPVENAAEPTIADAADLAPSEAGQEEKFYSFASDSYYFIDFSEAGDAASNDEKALEYGSNDAATTAAPELAEPPVEGDTVFDYGRVELPELPSSNTSVSLPPETSAGDGLSGGTAFAPPKTSTQADGAPLLIVWGAEPDTLALLRDAEQISAPEVMNEQENTLYSRLLESLPLAKALSEAAAERTPQSSVTAYCVDYAQLSALLQDCLGLYETAVYFPAEVTDAAHCTVLVISAPRE